MGTTRELTDRFWTTLAKDRTAMLGCTGVYPRPMTAIVEDGPGPIWFFTARGNDLADAASRRTRQGLLVFISKDHEFFATVGGQLRQDNDPAVIDRLWNPFIAAWYTGKDDPKLRLLRFDAGIGELWQNSSSLLAGIKLLLGADPKREFRDDVAKVRLGKG